MSSNANTNPTVENPTLWVLQSLDGQTLRIPDLWPLFGSWPRGRNGKYDDLKKQLDAFLLGTMNGDKHRLIKAAKPALLVADMWPSAGAREVSVLLFYVIWQGMLDEILEKLHALDLQRGGEIRRSLHQFIERSLGFHDGDGDNLHPALRVVAEFGPVASQIRKRYSGGQLLRLRNALVEYVSSTETEHDFAQKGEMPTYEVYCLLRQYTSGMGPLVALAEYASGANLPGWVTRSYPWWTLIDAVSRIVGFTNDLLSLKKEMTHKGFLNAIPVLLYEAPEMKHDIVEHIMREIAYLVREFDHAETELMRRADDDGEKEQIRAVTETLKCYCTGNLSWSLQAERYGLGEPAADGSLEVRLEITPTARGR